MKRNQTNACLQRKLKPEICILAGGLSRRMGRNKARLRLGRLSLLGHIKKTALKTGFPVRIIRRDITHRCGPLGGIYTALMITKADLLLFLPCDMPFITSRFLHDSLKKFRPSDKAMFISCNELIGFPLILRKDSLPVISGQINERHYSLENLAKVLGAKILTSPRSWRAQLLNINTQEDLAAARARVRKIMPKSPELAATLLVKTPCVH